MPNKERYYFIGIVMIMVILLFFWSFHPPHFPTHPAINASSHLLSKTLRHASNTPFSSNVERVESQKRFHQEASQTEHTEPRSGEKKIVEEERAKKGFHQRDPETVHMDMGHVDENKIDDKEHITDMEKGQEDLRKTDGGMEKYEKAREKIHGKRYLIYMCDEQLECSGFADRQRAIVGVYLLAVATNRSYGLIMRDPASIQDFYVPNKVKWDINPKDLVGKSTIDLDCFSKNNKCVFNDFNTFYPEDVIYMRSKNDFLHILGRLGQYRYNLPDWALGSRYLTFGQGWTTLMKPTALLRDAVNSLLLEVANSMLQDVKIISKMQETDSCIEACKQIKLGKVQSQSIVKCLDLLVRMKYLDQRDSVVVLHHICPVETAIMPPPLETIRTATGYDYVELELVCAQVRLGKSSSLRGEPELNKMEDVVKIWNFLRPYINKGHHMFLASDSQEVRDQAKELFGSRVHVNSDPIVHINKVRKTQDGWQGMKTALLEQLVLSTSCKVLVYSWSGFGKRSAMVRHFLTKGKKGFETYEFDNGVVKHKDFDFKAPVLPRKDK